MALPWLDRYLIPSVDAAYALWPRARPPAEQLRQARIISHRGERSRPGVLENTFAAFDPLRGQVWGLECDVRFSRDGMPMVFHDADLRRLFGIDVRLGELDFAQLRQRYPMIPTLQELVCRYRDSLHLMIEFKAEPRKNPQAQLDKLGEAFADLSPGEDFHLMALDIPTLDWLGQLWPQALVPIARSNVAQMSAYALNRPCAGLSGHYALLRSRVIRQHREQGQWCGVGFPESLNCLRYCLAQGATHLFTNQALALQAMLARENSSSKA